MMVDLDWSRLAETLSARRLLPTLGPRILELAEGRASDEFATLVEHAIDLGRHRGALLQLISTRAMAALANAGIRSTPLKGPILGEAIYGDLGRRLSGDIDLLVAPEQLDAAVEVIRGLGYGAPADHVGRNGLPLLHFALVHERRELPPVELHWRIHWYERSFASERLLPPTNDWPSDWRPAPADELAALLLFYARDGFIDLRLAADLGAWWDAFGAELPHGGLEPLLHIYPALARVLPAAVKTAERIVGLPATQIIGSTPELGLRDRIAVRMANPNPRSSQAQLYADMGLIDGLLMPQGDFSAFLRRQVLPPREVLEDRARQAQQRRGSSPFGHSARVLSRYGLALIRLVRVPEILRFT
jgi:hypothetical protein